MSSVASQQTRQGWHSVLVGGIATFMGAPQVEADADALRAAGVKAAFLGMPFDSTTIARPGAQLGRARVLRDLARGVVVRIPQDEALATWEPSWDRPPVFRPELALLGTGAPTGYRVVRERWAEA